MEEIYFKNRGNLFLKSRKSILKIETVEGQYQQRELCRKKTMMQVSNLKSEVNLNKNL